MFFAAAHKEGRLSIQSETGASYGDAHNSTAHPDNGYLQQDGVDTIANIATSTESDCAAIEQLMFMVKRLMAELVTVNAKLVTALHIKRDSQGGRGGRDRGRGRGAGDPAQIGAVATTGDEEQDPEPPIHYCWTCGTGCRHNSAKCPAPSTGHIYTATKRDMQGGAEATR